MLSCVNTMLDLCSSEYMFKHIYIAFGGIARLLITGSDICEDSDDL